MSIIPAANNLSIQVEGDTWSLINGRSESPTPVVEARPDGFSYRPAFGTARRLSPEGFLPLDQIAMVVVGWAVEDSSWHLGLMFTPEMAQARGGRWCGLARWENTDGNRASQAGEALAQTLHKPFRLVPPTDEAQAPLSTANDTVAGRAYSVSDTQQMAIPAAPVPVMALPITIGEWTLDGDEDRLIWQRSQAWRRKTLLNAAFFALLTVVFGALSLGAFMTIFAPVQPSWLPLVGLVLTLLMILLIIGQISTYMRATTILIDAHERFVRVMRNYNPQKPNAKSRRVLLQVPFEGIDYLLVSHVLTRHEKGKSAPGVPTPVHIWAEGWIHLFSPRRGFINTVYVTQVEGTLEPEVAFKARRELSLNEIDTPLHHAALHMAEMLNISAYAEGR